MKIGIFGGSFNPVHFGHLLIAKNALKQMNLDKVIFVPLKYPAHKNINELMDDNHRFNMLTLAIDKISNFEVSRYELDKDSTSYTYETLEFFNNIYINDEIYFILGMDSYHNLKNWKKPNIIFKLATLLVINRDFTSYQQIYDITKEYKKSYPMLKVEFIRMNNINISSTFIRDQIKNGESIKNFTPESVIHYIDKHKIYHGN